MTKRKVEIFTAGCPVCEDVVARVKGLQCPNCEIKIHDMNKGQGTAEARSYGVTALPAIAIDGKLLDCCRHAPISDDDLKASGIGQPI
ncbi:MAG: thioredoxin family protein [Deltaproteobacteria bacterium]|nr:thioredoxin family protein [Deltaproteobacteria bacterium]MBW2307620.1 thioredoxin family protein [Deltaproteobacteria bacterium]